MCDPVSIAITAAAVASAGVAVHQGNQQRKESKKAREEARNNALKAEEQADQEFNAQNKKAPNVGTLTANNTNASKAGVGSTLLTGPGGIGNDQLQLAQNTLLGG